MPEPTLFDVPLGTPQATYQRHSPTSRAAAASVAETAPRDRVRVLEFLRSRGAMGATDREIQDALDLGGSTERPRRIELQRVGAVVDSGRKRACPSGRLAVVFCYATGAGKAP